MDLVNVPVEGDEAFLVEVDRRKVRVGRGDDTVENAAESFQRSLERVRAIAETVMTSLSDLAQRPDRVRVEFGVKLTGEANVIVTRAGGEAHFVVEIEWERQAQRGGLTEPRA